MQLIRYFSCITIQLILVQTTVLQSIPTIERPTSSLDFRNPNDPIENGELISFYNISRRKLNETVADTNTSDNTSSNLTD